jgi:hypothetical protein
MTDKVLDSTLEEADAGLFETYVRQHNNQQEEVAAGVPTAV